MMRTVSQHADLDFTNAIDGPALTDRKWSLADAYSYCQALARSHYENFPVGSLLVPRRLRKHVWAIYAFARVADDFADESYDGNAVMHAQSERLECLARWRDLLLSCYRHRPSHPVFIALADTASSFDLPVALFDDLLSAFTQDVVKTSYADFAELMDYCRRSANPIGRLMLLLFGRREQELQLYSDSICTALQLTNHWQDVSIDLDKGRVYLPESDLKQHGLCTNDLRQAAGTERFRDLMHLQTGRTREMFELGKPLCRLLTGRFGLELRAIWLGGTTILSRIEQNGYDVFRHRPTLRFSDKLRILTRAFSRRGFHSQ